MPSVWAVEAAASVEAEDSRAAEARGPFCGALISRFDRGRVGSRDVFEATISGSS